MIDSGELPVILSNGAAVWLAEAGAAGTSRVRAKMAQAVALAKLHGAPQVSSRAGARGGPRPLR